MSNESGFLEELKEVPIDQIRVNPFQPRRHFDPQELEDLAASIRSVGLLHPPLVRPLPQENSFELISGERRFRATQLVGLKTIPVLIRHTGYEVSAQAALIENVQRVDLNAIEIAKALRRLVDEFGFQQDVLSNKIGKKRSTVANYLRLLGLPKNIQDSVSADVITMGHAKAILSLSNRETQQLLHELIIRDHLNVREAEAAALRIADREKKKPRTYIPRDFHLEQIADRLQQKLGTKVEIHGKGKKGRITINYYSFDDLDRLIDLLDKENKN